MHVFLTSSPCDDDVPAGVGLPCIYFEKNHFVENLKKCVKQNARLTVVAASPDDAPRNDEMTETFAGCFRYHGMKLSSVALCDARTEKDAQRMIRESDIVLLGGGHVPTQNEFFKRIHLKELLEGYQGVVMGISAGTMNCASTVYAQPEMPGESLDPDYRRFIPGLGLTDVMVLPHYQKERYTILDGKKLYEEITYPDSYDREFIAIPDGSYVLVENGKATLYGEGYCISEGVIYQLCEDETAVVL